MHGETVDSSGIFSADFTLKNQNQSEIEQFELPLGYPQSLL